ncbi:MAG: transposase [Tannerella sp.]|nr:transposase [Tannerella sp.]
MNDRMSFMRFLDLTIASGIPDSKTVWAFRERVTDFSQLSSQVRAWVTMFVNGLTVTDHWRMNKRRGATRKSPIFARGWSLFLALWRCR